MIREQQWLGWRRLAMSIPWVLALIIGLLALAGGRGEGTGRASLTAPPPTDRALPIRLAAVDEALARRDMSRAVLGKDQLVDDPAAWRSVPADRIRKGARHVLQENDQKLKKLGASTVAQFLASSAN